MAYLKRLLGMCVLGLVSTTPPLPCLAAAGAGNAVTVTGTVLMRNENGKTVVSKPLLPGDAVTPGTVINTASTGGVKLLMTDKSIVDLGPSTLFKVDEYELRNGGNRKVEMTLSYGKMRAAVNTKISGDGQFRIRTRSATMGVRGTEFVILTDLGDFITPTKAAEIAKQQGNSGTTGTAPKTNSGIAITENKDSGGEKKAGDTGGRTQITVIEGKVEVTTGKGADDSGKQKQETKAEQKTVILDEGSQLQTKNDTKEHPETEKSPSKGGSGASVTSETTSEPTVTKLSVEQIKVVAVEAKMEDQTFVQAVTIDDSINNDSGRKNGNETLTQLSTDIALPTNLVPQTGDLKLPGTFGSGLAIDSSPLNQNNSLPINVRVIFRR